MERISVKDLRIGDIENFTKSLCGGKITGINCGTINGDIKTIEVTRNVKNIEMKTQDVTVDNKTTFIDDESSPIGVTAYNKYVVYREIGETFSSADYVNMVKETKEYMDIQDKFESTKTTNVTDKFMVSLNRASMLEK